MNDFSAAPYEHLTPDLILAAVESLGRFSNGRLLALNSYENRVYQIGMEEGPALVAKFYRPGRWSDEEILEEHRFSYELAENEIPLALPLRNEAGESLMRHAGFRFAVFPSVGGRHAELDNDEHLKWLGRYLGRMHMVGRASRFQYRPRIDIQHMGIDAYQYVLAHDFIPTELQPAYRTIVEDVLARVETIFEAVLGVPYIRLHGDCHGGNVMWTPDGPCFVDMDDCRSGPAVQDLWMLLSGSREEQQRQLGVLLEGYEQFSLFDPTELVLIEPLRALRMIHYSAWLARRWQDPAFPQAFPWFGQPRYWEDQILALREQLAAFDEPTLSLL